LNELFKFGEIDSVNDLSAAIEFAKNVSFYRFGGLKEDSINCIYNIAAAKIFKYLFQQPIFINKLN